MTQAQDILDFWREAGPEKWFTKDDVFDAAIRERFASTVEDARAGKLDSWAGTPDGLLALVIVLDQFPRNLYRDDPRAFASDARGAELARQAEREGWIEKMPQDMAAFALMPLMHSEDMADQDLCVEAMKRHGFEANVPHAEEHRDIIAHFGRFPHRNEVLGRETTDDERVFLEAGGFAG